MIPIVIENPPKGLERVIREYYLKFAPTLLGRCQKLLNESTTTNNKNNNNNNNNQENNTMEIEKTNNNNNNEKIEDVLNGSSDAFKKKLSSHTIPNLTKAFKSNEEKYKLMSKQE